MSSTTPFAAAAPPLLEPTSGFTAALLFLTPLLLSAHDARAGLRLGLAVLATLLLVQALLHLAGTQRRSAFAAALWSTVAVALASWFLPAHDLLEPAQIALLPLIAANAAWWKTQQTRSAIALGASSLVLALACVAIGLLRGIVAALAPDGSRMFISGLAQWLASPPGLAITAALALALWQHLRPLPAAAPERDSHAP
jgi:hypothetical protein